MARKEKVIVTGASGFIGKHLVTALEKKNLEIIQVPHQSLNDINGLQQSLQYIKPDYIYHLAAYGNMYHQKEEEQEIFDANLMKTWNLLQATKHISYKAFINVSSSSVTLPHQTIYAATKLGAEVLCKAFVDEYKKPIVTVRPFTIIGRGEQSEHLIPRLIHSCMTGKKIPFNPYPVHDFVDVRDLVDAMQEIAEDIDEYKGKAIGIGTGKQYRNDEILALVEKLTGKKANLEFKDSIKRTYDIDEWHARLHHDYIVARYSLEETIRWMI